MDADAKARLYMSCTRFLSGDYPRTPRQVLSELAAMPEAELPPDRYGEGELITGFEAEGAALLGKEAAVFIPSGTMCQQIVLRIWCERRNNLRVAFHPTCHLEIHEQHGYQWLHGLHGVLVGSPERLITLDDLQKLNQPLGALLLELPQREIGGQLPTWDELTAIIAWARERGIPTHMDGARLWESQPFYKRSYAEICDLFDSVYVSFYKTLGGIAGAMLAGPADVIAEARIWQRRHGGNLVQLYPYVLAARKGLNDHLDHMEAYYAKAKAIAAALATFPQIEIVPNPPHSNKMHVFLRGRADKLQAAVLEIAQETGTWLISWFAPTSMPAYQKFELTVGGATLDLSEEEIVTLFHTLFEKAG